MLARRDRFCGNILLYDYLSTKRAPVILNRNLTRAFRVHQHLLLGGDTEVFAGPDHSLRFKWRPPSWDHLDDMMETEIADGSFCMNIESIRLHDRPHSARSGDRDARARKARVLLRAKSSIKASFFPASSQVCRTRATVDAVMKADNRGTEGSASLEMEPFVIKHQSLAPGSSRMISGASYLMEIRLTFSSIDDAQEFYGYMGVKNAAGNPLQLITIYENILHCPAGPILLQLRDHSKQLVFDLVVYMWWANTVSKSILERSNRALRSREARTRPYLTPPLDVDRQPKFQIKFVHGNRIVKKTGLFCPLEGCRIHKMADIKDLRMHLDSFHDHLSYTAVREHIDTDGVEHWRFEGEIADHRAEQRASDRTDEPIDVHVHAPEHPFDRDLHLQGNNKFHQVATKKLPPKHLGLKGRQATSITHIKVKRKPPEDVQARPARLRKAWVVPEAPPGITFFRSVTKQPLHAGDEISESDDELDLGWMQLRKNAEIDRNNIPEASRRFQKVYDDFMGDENLQSDVHASDAVVRFTRGKRKWISEEDVFGELSSKLDELLEDGVITKDVHTACLEIARTPRMDADEVQQQLTRLQVESPEMALHPARFEVNRQSKMERDRKSKGEAKLTETGHLTPITADSDGDVEMREAALNSDAEMSQLPRFSSTIQPVYDECYCGEDALVSFNTAPVIACSKVDCNRRHFHIQCVQNHTKKPLPLLNPKIRDWTCDDCKIISNSGI